MNWMTLIWCEVNKCGRLFEVCVCVCVCVLFVYMYVHACMYACMHSRTFDEGDERVR